MEVLSKEKSQEASWDTHLTEEPSAREENEQAATDAVRLQGHVVEALSAHHRGGHKSVKTWRYRIVREADGAVRFDMGQFIPKQAARNVIKRALAQLVDIDILNKQREEGAPRNAHS